MSKRVALVVGAVIIIVGLIVLLLSTGGVSDTASREDPADDVVLGEGSDRPQHLGLVDVREVTVRSEGGLVRFEARMERPLALRFPQESAVWRWEINEAGELTWIISVNLDVGANVSIIATQRDYSASTINKTFPGKVSVRGDVILVRLETTELEGWPVSFETVLKTTLDGSRTKATSALAEDRVPDGGYLQVGG